LNHNGENMARLTPQQLYDNYRQGLQGAIWLQHEFDHLMESLKYPYFGDASAKISNSGKGKLSIPYKSVLKFDKKPYEERQTTGDCLVRGTAVLMSDGSTKNIEDIKIGDSVITHNNRSKHVYELINKKPSEEQINHIYIKKYDKNISMTNDHKMLIFNDNGYEWIEAKNLKEGDLLVLPKKETKNSDDTTLDLSQYVSNLQYEMTDTAIRIKNSKNTLPRYIRLSTDLMWLFGLYAAEGGIDGDNKERITFNLHIKETQLRDRIIYLLDNIFGAKCTTINRIDKNVCCVRCSNIIVSRLFSYFINGNQWSKNLNRKIINTSKYHRIAFLRGWSDGDGSVTTYRRRKLVGVSVSGSLIRDISDILISLQIQHTITKRKPRNRSKSAYQVDLYGDQVYKIYPELFVMTKVKVKQNKLTCSLGLLAPITKITKEKYTDNVYCINVQDDHSFIANGLISHNCVSHGTRNACDISRAVEIDIHSEKESWIARGATEAIYGARGWSGQGMTGSKAAEFVNKIGGILVRKNYDGVVDLSKYNSNLGAGWGGRGVPDKILDLANDHQIKTVSLIQSVEEARDALANGYGIAVCSNYGFSNKRDSKGYARTSGSWAHCMAWIGCDDTGSDTSFLVQNSWGKWNDGGHPEWGVIPDGSFLIHSDVAEGMIKQNGAYAFSNFNGFPVQKLPDYGFDYV
jgi:intein/homing endonuclease